MCKVQSITTILLILQFLSSARSHKLELDPPTLLQDMGPHDQVTVMISFNDYDTLKRIRKATAESAWWTRANRTARLSGMRTALKAHADQVQRPILSMLKQAQGRTLDGTPSIQFHQLWVSNKIVVKFAPKSVLEQLFTFPQVAKIQKDRVFKWKVPIPSHSTMTMREGNSVSQLLRTPLDPYTAPDGSSLNWGANKMHVQYFWRKGYIGQRTSVCVIDTGFNSDHEAFPGNFGGWRDFVTFNPTPVDDVGHGIHCAANVAGKPEIGIAPGTQLSACRACNMKGCGQAALESCCQWSVCPDELYCDTAPNAVSNSWGALDILGVMGAVDDWMKPYLDMWEYGDTFVAIAAGNSDTGITCGGASYPGNSVQACAVGSTDMDDKVSDYSNRGPTVSSLAAGETKPNCVAPGRDVYGAWIFGPHSYVTMSGTSMATPMVAGIALLIKSACPSLTRDEILDVMCRGAVRLTGTCDFLASYLYGATRPNIDAGCGRPDMKKIFDILYNECFSLEPPYQ